MKKITLCSHWAFRNFILTYRNIFCSLAQLLVCLEHFSNTIPCQQEQQKQSSRSKRKHWMFLNKFCFCCTQVAWKHDQKMFAIKICTKWSKKEQKMFAAESREFKVTKLQPSVALQNLGGLERLIVVLYYLAWSFIAFLRSCMAF